MFFSAFFDNDDNLIPGRVFLCYTAPCWQWSNFVIFQQVWHVLTSLRISLYSNIGAEKTVSYPLIHQGKRMMLCHNDNHLTCLSSSTMSQVMDVYSIGCLLVVWYSGNTWIGWYVTKKGMLIELSLVRHCYTICKLDDATLSAGAGWQLWYCSYLAWYTMANGRMFRQSYQQNIKAFDV